MRSMPARLWLGFVGRSGLRTFGGGIFLSLKSMGFLRSHSARSYSIHLEAVLVYYHFLCQGVFTSFSKVKSRH